MFLVDGVYAMIRPCLLWLVYHRMMFSLEGKKAVVTGASGSIGRAIAIKLAEQGASVVLSGTREEALYDLANLIDRSHVLVGDLSSARDVDALIEKAESLLGGLDILINNAGVNRDMLLGKMNESDLEAVFKVNVNAVFGLSKRAIQSMFRKDMAGLLI
jgi:3-oxoacyl-[acyl-carrier protein] reductase